MMLPECVFCGDVMTSTSVFDLLWVYRSEVGSAALRDVFIREGNLPAFECESCMVWLAVA